MTTKPSSAPWVDGPHKLIPTPDKQTKDNNTDAIYCASEMAHAHNCMIRCFNAVELQGPHIPSSDQPRYVEADVRDLMIYIESFCKAVDHHHHTEETVMFPAIEKELNEPGLLTVATEQHDAFHVGLIEFRDYAIRCRAKPEEYRWVELKTLMDKFLPTFVHHLTDEVHLFETFSRFDGKKLRKAWDIGEAAAKASGKVDFLYDIFPAILTGVDNTYEGGNNFPPIPSALRYAISWWFGRTYSGAWRYAPCDVWGQPRPLQMLPENRN